MKVLYISLIGSLLISCTPVLVPNTAMAIATKSPTEIVPPPITPTATTPPLFSIPLSGGDPVLVGAGDIASCSGGGDEATAALLDDIPGIVFTAGDNVYPNGDETDYMNCYVPSWGRHKARTYPAVGNHDYYTERAGAYFNYFGPLAGEPDKGYYSYDLGTWHIIVLNSEIRVGTGSLQEQWLRMDLAAHQVDCTLAYWHKPRFSSGDMHGSNDRMHPLWQALYDFGADVVLAGHEHNYERFAPQTPQGAVDPVRGIRQFVVGTGGVSHYPITNPIANSQVQNTDTFGVLKLILHPGSYSWEFIPVEGGTFTDSGSAPCVTHKPIASDDILIFTPSDDATIKSSLPDSSFGLESHLQADNIPYDNFLIKFDVSGINNRPVLSAKMRLYNVNRSDMGGYFFRAAGNEWMEETVTWSNAPLTDSTILASLGFVSKDTWYELDLTSLVTGDGVYTIRAVSISEDGANYMSKEGQAGLAPQLIVSVGRSVTP